MRLPSLISLTLVTFSLASAHEIPADVTVRMFLAPQGKTLRMLVRVPLPALRDIDIRESAPGIADLPGLTRQLRDAATVWLSGFIEVKENERTLPPPSVVAVRMTLPGDRSFATLEGALSHLNAPALPEATQVAWSQLFVDVQFEYPIASAENRFSINPRLRTLAARVVTVLRFVPQGAPERAFEFVGDPGLIVLDPSWTQAAGRFVRLGFHHILDGIDHLLFLVCLVLPLRRIRPLVLVVTAFTAAHSITLLASAFNAAPGALWFPPLVETLIAASIVYMGLENIASDRQRGHRWVLAFGFGLIHGFGFSFALKETLQFAGKHLLTSLLAFNLGVELGQLAVLALLVPVLTLVFRYVVAERLGIIILSALVVHTAWHWMTERAQILRKYDFTWNEESTALALRWAFLMVLAAGAAWFWPKRERPEHGNHG